MQEKDKIVINNENGDQINCIILLITKFNNKNYIIYKYENNPSFDKELLASEILINDDNTYKLLPIDSDVVWNELEKKYRNLHNLVKEEGEK